MKAEIAFRKSSLKYTVILKAAINSDMALLLFQAGNTMLGKKKWFRVRTDTLYFNFYSDLPILVLLNKKKESWSLNGVNAFSSEKSNSDF